MDTTIFPPPFLSAPPAPPAEDIPPETSISAEVEIAQQIPDVPQLPHTASEIVEPVLDAAPEQTQEAEISESVNVPPISYDRFALHWNPQHSTNQERKYCYCEKDRTLFEPNLHCAVCKNIYHASCIRYKLPRLPCFIKNYRFECSWCTNGEEIFELNELNTWKDIAVTAFCNLMLQQAKNRKVDLRLREDGTTTENAVFPGDWTLDFRSIRDWCSLPWVWAAVGVGKDQNFPVLRTVFSSYSKPEKQKQVFEETKGESGKVVWTLVNRDLFSTTPYPPSSTVPTPKRVKRSFLPEDGEGISLSKYKKTKGSGSSTPTFMDQQCGSCSLLKEENSMLAAQLQETKQRMDDTMTKLTNLEEAFEAKQREVAELSRLLLAKQNQELAENNSMQASV